MSDNEHGPVHAVRVQPSGSRARIIPLARYAPIRRVWWFAGVRRQGPWSPAAPDLCL